MNSSTILYIRRKERERERREEGEREREERGRREEGRRKHSLGSTITIFLSSYLSY